MTDEQRDLQKAKLFNNTIQPHCLMPTTPGNIRERIEINNINMHMLQNCRSAHQVAYHIGNLFLAVVLLEDECHCLELKAVKHNIVQPDDRTTSATHASRYTSLQENISLVEILYVHETYMFQCISCMIHAQVYNCMHGTPDTVFDSKQLQGTAVAHTFSNFSEVYM